MEAQKTAAYKVISDADGNRYRFYCELSGALACTTEPLCAQTPEEELRIAWETGGRKHLSLCHKCGRWVIDAVYNVDVFECVECAPYEEEPNYCKNCGIRIEKTSGKCPACGHKLVYEGEESAK
ncbi:MAG: hypothetical protein E7579_06650 [Ruminococcaceae bacterium]|nr:hypothetical protein [Oscillospiraceae bacterium]